LRPDVREKAEVNEERLEKEVGELKNEIDVGRKCFSGEITLT